MNGYNQLLFFIVGLLLHIGNICTSDHEIDGFNKPFHAMQPLVLDPSRTMQTVGHSGLKQEQHPERSRYNIDLNSASSPTDGAPPYVSKTRPNSPITDYNNNIGSYVTNEQSNTTGYLSLQEQTNCCWKVFISCFCCCSEWQEFLNKGVMYS